MVGVPRFVWKNLVLSWARCLGARAFRNELVYAEAREQFDEDRRIFSEYRARCA